MTTNSKTAEKEEEGADRAELTELKKFIRKKQLENQILKKITESLEETALKVNPDKDAEKQYGT